MLVAEGDIGSSSAKILARLSTGFAQSKAQGRCSGNADFSPASSGSCLHPACPGPEASYTSTPLQPCSAQLHGPGMGVTHRQQVPGEPRPQHKEAWLYPTLLPTSFYSLGTELLSAPALLPVFLQHPSAGPPTSWG